jgi:hypothetical protein
VTQSTWKKSHARSVSAWVRRKLRQVWSLAASWRGRQAPGAQDAADRRGGDAMAQAAQLALDPLVSPRRVLGGQPHDQSGQAVADRRPARRPGLAPFTGGQTAMPPQDGARGDQPADTQLPGQNPDERGQHCAVSPVQARFRNSTPQHGDLMAEHQDLGVLGGAAAGEKHEPGQYPAEHQVDQAWRHNCRSCRIS